MWFIRLTPELWRLRVSEITPNYQNGCGPSYFQSGSSGPLPARRPLRTSPCQLSRQAAQAFQTPPQGRGLTPQVLPDLHDTHLETKSGPIIADRRLAPVVKATVLSTNSCFASRSSSLVTNDPPEVCPLARGANLEPLSSPLQTGFRFLRRPLPANRLASLAARCLCLAERFTGLPRFVSAPL